MSKANVSLGNFEAVEEFTENDNFSTSIYEQDYDGLLIARCNQNGRYPEHARAVLEGLNGKKLALDEITRLHAEVAALRAENERLRRVAERRDEFIIGRGLWEEFKEAACD
ncbi:hypothetical protein [Rhizobium rhizogenes]|uniref:hypothetical protein n=1 Tax=Rhizobium rhizogenes TaxID=359 RepID=UPI0015748887|nr:hypothetical protein [Rhizobium rhizogenes]NTG07183.1 hypothetical protein [Rhizobium rhizogenes]